MVPQLIVVRRKFACTKDLESYTGSSVSTCGASHTGQVKGYVPDKESYTDPLGWGLCGKLVASNVKKSTLSSKLEHA
jgi:hypothetical protein